MATFTITRQSTGEKKEVKLTYNPAAAMVQEIQCTTPLDQGSNNSGGRVHGTKDGLLFGKTYEFKVSKYQNNLIPSQEQIDCITWEYSYLDDNGNEINCTAETTGETFSLQINDLEMCGRDINICAYGVDKYSEGFLSNFCHYRYRWFDRSNVIFEINRRKRQPWLIDQNHTPLCGMVCILYAMIKFDPDGYEKFALDLHRKGEANYNNYQINPEEELFEKKKTDRDYPKGGYFNRPMPEIDWITLVGLRNNEKKGYDGKHTEQAAGINWPWVMKHLSENFLKASSIEKEWRPVKNFSKKNYEVLDEIDDLHNKGYVVFILCDSDMVYPMKASTVGFVNHWVPYMGKIPDINNGFLDLYDDIKGIFSFRVASWGKVGDLKQLKFNIFNTNYYGYIAVKN